MKTPESQTLCLRGRLIDLSRPKIMGIVNVTPDSFYAGSRTATARELTDRISRMAEEGTDIFDIGGYSSRPGAEDVSLEEEYSRLCRGIEIARLVAPGIPISVDTFRSSVARRCAEEWGVEIINDISGGALDPEMWATVAETGCAYVLMHMRGTPATMQSMTEYVDVVDEVFGELSFSVARLRETGVADIIVDPGFGFAKTREQNFRLLKDLNIFRQTGCPILVGVSRKSMITRTLGVTPQEALNGTTALNTMALMNGASILRVHDVKEAKETLALYQAFMES